MMGILKFDGKVAKKIISQTLPLSLSSAVELFCALVTTAQFKLFNTDQVLQAATWSAIFSIIMFVPFFLRGFLIVSTTLISKAQNIGDEEDIWRITRRTIKYGIVSSFIIGSLVLLAKPVLGGFFWRDIPDDLLTVGLIVVCLTIPIGSITKTLFITCRSLGKVSIPTTTTITSSVLELSMNIYLIPLYGFYGALFSFVLMQYIIVPITLLVFLKLGKLPFKIIKGVKEDYDLAIFHLKQSIPEVCGLLAHSFGSLCIGLSSGIVNAATMLACNIFMDIVDFLCSIGVVQTVTNQMSAKGERCLKEGIVSIGLLSSVLTLVVIFFMPNIASFITNDVGIINMLTSSCVVLFFYIVLSNESDVVGGYLRGNLMNQATGGYSTISMILFRCVLPFVFVQFGFIGVISCYAANRISLFVGYSIITLKNRDELNTKMEKSASLV